MENKIKKILLIGSDSRIAKKLLEYIIKQGDELTTVSRKVSSWPNKLHFCVDLSDNDEVIELANNISKYYYDVFIYLPGVFKPSPTTSLNFTEIIKQVNVNLVSAINLSIPVLNKMFKRRKGMMLFIGSSSAYAGFKNTSVYCSAKHGLLGFTRSLADEFRNKGIKISCISPGSVDTKMSKPLHKDMDPNTFICPDEIAELLIDLIYSPKESMWQEEIILKRLKY